MYPGSRSTTPPAGSYPTCSPWWWCASTLTRCHTRCPWQRPSATLAPARGSWWLWAARLCHGERWSHWALSHCLSCSSQPPPKSPTPPPLAIQVAFDIMALNETSACPPVGHPSAVLRDGSASSACLAWFLQGPGAHTPYSPRSAAEAAQQPWEAVCSSPRNSLTSASR